MNGSIKSKLEIIKDSASDVKMRIDELLKKDDRIGLATTDTTPYEQDFYRLMREMADVANPVLQQMGLDKEAITSDIEEFVKILQDNEHVLYFAAVNVDAKYSKNRYALINLQNWLGRFQKSIDRVIAFIETDTESKGLEGLFKTVDSLKISEKEKEALKKEFLDALNRMNSHV